MKNVFLTHLPGILGYLWVTGRFLTEGYTLLSTRRYTRMPVGYLLGSAGQLLTPGQALDNLSLNFLNILGYFRVSSDASWIVDQLSMGKLPIILCDWGLSVNLCGHYDSLLYCLAVTIMGPCLCVTYIALLFNEKFYSNCFLVFWSYNSFLTVLYGWCLYWYQVTVRSAYILCTL